jgi:hypothetical protein
VWRAYRGYRMSVEPGTETPDDKRLTVDLPNGMGAAVAVTPHHEEGGLIVATILDWEGGQ